MPHAPKIALLIDADNLTIDVMEQAVKQLLAEHGALHVRRAYCTAESAQKNQAVFKRLGIRPMVNLASGKNSTDIALAVDAIDLVLTERPDIVVIASSDSDFTPLVARLREKGCRVLGIGQDGKTGDETQTAYDAFTVLAHRKRSAAVKEPAVPGKKAAARKSPRRASASPAVQPPPAPRPPPPPLPPPPPAAPVWPEAMRSILDALPELERGEPVTLQDASTRLRAAGVLSRNRSSAKLFGEFGEHFEVQPQTKQLRLRLPRLAG
jgi:uncharacterized protein (TIGR00288 family)